MEDETNKQKSVKAEDSSQSEEDTSHYCRFISSDFLYKCYFFLFYTAIGSLLPYLALYLKQVGLTAEQAGAVVGLRLLIEFIASPLLGMLGDKYKISKAILMVSLMSFATGNLLLISVQPQKQTCIEIGENRTVIKALIFAPEGIVLGPATEKIVNSSEIWKDYLGNKNLTNSFIREVDKPELARIFLIFLGATFLSQIIGSVVFTMPDALVVGFLQENISKFGTFRMWGEVGVVAGSSLVGGVISLYKSEVCGEMMKNYNISFYFFARLITLTMINCLFLEVKYPESSNRVNFAPVISEFLRGCNLMLILVTCYFGILNGMEENFGLWYLDDLGAQPYMVGIASGLRFSVSFLGYYSSGACIDRLGFFSTLAGCMLVYIVVMLGFAFVLNPWLGVALHSIQGLLYGLAWSSCVVFSGTVSVKVGFYSAVQGKFFYLLILFKVLVFISHDISYTKAIFSPRFPIITNFLKLMIQEATRYAIWECAAVMFQKSPHYFFVSRYPSTFQWREKSADAAKPNKQENNKYDVRCKLLWFCFCRSGFVGGVHWGLGVGIGISASGIIINRIGIPQTYFMYAMTSIAMLTFMLLSYWLIKSREDKVEAMEISYQLVPQNKDDAE